MIHPKHIDNRNTISRDPEIEFKILRVLYERELKGAIYGLPVISLFIIWLSWPLRQNVVAIILTLFIVIALLGLSFWHYRKLKAKMHERKISEDDQNYLNRFMSIIEKRKKNLLALNFSLIFLVIFAMNLLQRIEIEQSVSDLLSESGMNVLGSTLVFCTIFGLANYATNGFRYSEFEDGFNRIRSQLNN